MWEEPCISGTGGSGAVFFSGCPLHCCYCQNQNIANGMAGRIISAGRLSEIFLELQEKGANNINLVTPDMFAPQIKEALLRAKAQGLRLPVVYNTSGYVKADTLGQLEGLIDIYLPDFKYFDPERAMRYSHAPDYFDAASAALAEMVRQTGEALFYYRFPDGTCRPAGDGQNYADLCAAGTGAQDDAGLNGAGAGGDMQAGAQLLMRRGVIVRHLQLPGGLSDSKRVMKYLSESYGNRIYYSILSQYTPVVHSERFPELNRRLRRREYDRLVDYCIGLGIENAFIQDSLAACRGFIPEFDGEGL